MQLGHGRPDQPEHGFEVVAVEAAVASSAAVVALTGSSMGFAYPISPSAALTDVLVMLVLLSCDLDSVGPAANAGVAGVRVQLPSDDAVQSVFGQRVRPRAAAGEGRIANTLSGPAASALRTSSSCGVPNPLVGFATGTTGLPSRDKRLPQHDQRLRTWGLRSLLVSSARRGGNSMHSPGARTWNTPTGADAFTQPSRSQIEKINTGEQHRRRVRQPGPGRRARRPSPAQRGSSTVPK